MSSFLPPQKIFIISHIFPKKTLAIQSQFEDYTYCKFRQFRIPKSSQTENVLYKERNFLRYRILKLLQFETRAMYNSLQDARGFCIIFKP